MAWITKVNDNELLLVNEFYKLLNVMSIATITSHKAHGRTSLMSFNNSYLLNSDLAPNLLKMSNKQWGIFPNVKPADVNNNWDVSLLCSVSDSDHHFALRRFRSVPLKSVRGMKIYSSIIGEYSEATIDLNTKTYETQIIHFQYVSNKWLRIDKPNMVLNVDALNERLNGIDVYLGWQFSQYYEWKVCFANNANSPAIAINVDIAAIKELFKLRDVPEGYSRRVALVHWVQGHWRNKPLATTEDDLAWIKQHLRGHIQFDWLGLQCKIVPSNEAIVINERKKLYSAGVKF